MRRTCAWCAAELPEDERPGTAITHGICASCLWREFGLTEAALADFDETKRPEEQNETDDLSRP